MSTQEIALKFETHVFVALKKEALICITYQAAVDKATHVFKLHTIN